MTGLTRSDLDAYWGSLLAALTRAPLPKTAHVLPAAVAAERRLAMVQAIRYAANRETNEAGQTNCVDLLALADRIESGEETVT